MLINVKMLTLVGILKYIIMIRTTIQSVIARNVLFFLQRISFNEQLKVRAKLSIKSF